jgi:hypothetical protein
MDIHRSELKAAAVGGDPDLAVRGRSVPVSEYVTAAVGVVGGAGDVGVSSSAHADRHTQRENRDDVVDAATFTAPNMLLRDY